MKAYQWIDRLKVEKNLPSDYAAAKMLGLTQPSIIKMRTNKDATLGEDTCIKIADLLEINPSVILAEQSMERAKGQEAKNAWGVILERLGGVTAAVAIGVGLAGAPSQSDAKSAQKEASSVYYVKLRRRSLWGQLLSHGAA